MMNFSINPIDPTDPTHLEAVAGLWTGACGHALATSPRTVAYNLRSLLDDKNVDSQKISAPSRPLEMWYGDFLAKYKGAFAWHNEEPVGAVIIDARANPLDGEVDVGYISLLAVLPETGRQGVGQMLLEWAEEQLQVAGCKVIQLGGNEHSFVPGLPTELATEQFFTQRGYVQNATVTDMAANLAGYQPPPTVREVDAAIRTAQTSNIGDIQAFVQREFPEQSTQVEQILQDLQTPGRAERISDYMILWTERGIDGICRLNFEDSYRPIELCYPYQLPRPWGEVGSFGISKNIRGQGFGAALIDASLRRLHNNGVNGCIINATTDVDLYAKFGFTPSREYGIYRKTGC